MKAFGEKSKQEKSEWKGIIKRNDTFKKKKIFIYPFSFNAWH